VRGLDPRAHPAARAHRVDPQLARDRVDLRLVVAAQQVDLVARGLQAGDLVREPGAQVLVYQEARAHDAVLGELARAAPGGPGGAAAEPRTAEAVGRRIGAQRDARARDLVEVAVDRQRHRARLGE